MNIINFIATVYLGEVSMSVCVYVCVFFLASCYQPQQPQYPALNFYSPLV